MSTNTELIAELYASDAASALTNRAGRAIEAMEAEVERLKGLYESSTAAHEETVGRAMRAEAQLAAAQGQITLTEVEISLGAHNEDPGDWNDLNFRDSWHEGFASGAKFALAEMRSKQNKGAGKRFVGLDAEEIGRIPLNERTLQTVESLLREKNAAPIPQQPATAPSSLSLLSEAFRTTESNGASSDYRMVFKFKDLASLHSADDEWRKFKGAV